MRYSFSVLFEAENMEAAENRVANWLGQMYHQGRGSSLSYEDPITGGLKLWAEPAMTKSELVAHRDRS